MPYIKKTERALYDGWIDNIAATMNDATVDHEGVIDVALFWGSLNYIISSVVIRSIRSCFGALRYHLICAAVGTFDCAKLELYRRVGAPYEDKAIEKAGDIDGYV